MPTIIENTSPLPGLSPASGKAMSARFDGGSLSSNAGLLTLREVGRWLDVAGSVAQVPRQVTLDIDDTFDAIHGGQPLRLFNAYKATPNNNAFYCSQAARHGPGEMADANGAAWQR